LPTLPPQRRPKKLLQPEGEEAGLLPTENRTTKHLDENIEHIEFINKVKKAVDNKNID
jgi:hypothetical protein